MSDQGDIVHVLDHGFVRLVSCMGSDLSVVRAARVSYDADWRAGEDEKGDQRLIRYLWKHQHTTPFEAVTMTFEVMAPIFVLRQWHRHRTQSYNELSARYRELPEVFYTPALDKVGRQDPKHKQARILGDMDKFNTPEDVASRDAYQIHCHKSFELYKKLLGSGWPRELARAVLPVSTYSHMFTTMNLLNCFRFLKLRMHEHAQYEIRVYADAMCELIQPRFPVCVTAFRDSLHENTR